MFGACPLQESKRVAAPFALLLLSLTGGEAAITAPKVSPYPNAYLVFIPLFDFLLSLAQGWDVRRPLSADQQSSSDAIASPPWVPHRREFRQTRSSTCAFTLPLATPSFPSPLCCHPYIVMTHVVDCMVRAELTHHVPFRMPDKAMVEAMDSAAKRLPMPPEQLAEELRANLQRWRQHRAAARSRLIGRGASMPRGGGCGPAGSSRGGISARATGNRDTITVAGEGAT